MICSTSRQSEPDHVSHLATLTSHRLFRELTCIIRFDNFLARHQLRTAQHLPHVFGYNCYRCTCIFHHLHILVHDVHCLEDFSASSGETTKIHVAIRFVDFYICLRSNKVVPTDIWTACCKMAVFLARSCSSNCRSCKKRDISSL